MTRTSTNISIDDLEYELRMLLGAAKVCKVLEKANAGNVVNYAKDAVYLHGRNLYNFFSNAAHNDAKVKQFTTHTFDLSTYNTWIGAWHDHAVHIKTKRSHNPSNVINGVRLNEKIQSFTSDIEGMWVEWIANTSEATLKAQLSDALDRARDESDDDAANLRSLLTKKSS